MKRYKIVQHYTDPDEYMFRIYERTWWFFGWNWITSYSTVERCEIYIADVEREERNQLDIIKNTPGDKLVKYIG
jgi:hypothetical protein